MTIQEHIKNYILSNLVKDEERKVGVELECIFYDQGMRRIPVNPCDSFSAADVLHALKETDIINEKGVSASLEPGGQIEWGSTPFVNLHDINLQLESYMSTLNEITSAHDFFLADYAMDPLYHPGEIELIDQEKYQFMRNSFDKIGPRGSWMMRCSSSVQVNIDLSSEEDAEEMAFIADCITPIVSILFSNSPFLTGEISGSENLRYCIWNETDPIRTGSLLSHGINNKEGLLDKLCEYLPEVPAIFVTDSANKFSGFDGSLGNWLENLEKLGKLGRKDILTLLHQIFTHVRFKNVVEIRGMDRPPKGFEMAPVAFWTGILMSEKSREELSDIVEEWSHEDRLALETAVKILDVSQPGPNGKSLEEWLYILCDIALSGLKERAEKFDWDNEDKYLTPFLSEIKSKGIFTLSIQNEFRNSGRPLRQFLMERKAIV